MNQNFTKFAFTKSVKEVQDHYGTRNSYARMEASGDRFTLTYNEISFIQSRDSFYMGTIGDNGWPYVQFRGGPKGFLKVIDDSTIAYVDFRGNGQYISTGNINDNNKTSLFLMDYPSQRRLKIWAESTIIQANENEELLKKLQVEGYKARIERIVIFKIQAYDWNCPQHITPRYTADEITQM
ncbi:MAG: pyridoxamine 5'-phosphate oxidase family protein [Gammaproteobacteria bacterium]|nr:MAG: pyridoxamine 5'-phosphate oxidase family protein [Gammaproteobacteria bacterium]